MSDATRNGHWMSDQPIAHRCNFCVRNHSLPSSADLPSGGISACPLSSIAFGVDLCGTLMHRLERGGVAHTIRCPSSRPSFPLPLLAWPRLSSGAA